MSFIKGKQNLYSTVSNSIIQQIKTIHEKNIKSNPSFKLYDQSYQSNTINGMPTTLLVTSVANIECGDPVNCYNCMKLFGITDNTLINYNKNLNTINDIRNNQCFGLCSCNVQNINLSNTLVFAVGYNINGSDIDTQDIYNNTINELTHYNSTSTSTTSWLNSFLGVPGVTYGTHPDPGVVEKEVHDDMTRLVDNITLIFNQTINQLLSSSQTLEIKGTGIQIKNLSITTIQNATLSAIENNNCVGGTCIDDTMANIVNTLITTLSNSIQTGFDSSWKYAYEQNKNLLIGAAIFIPLLIILYVFLLFKKAASKKSS